MKVQLVVILMHGADYVRYGDAFPEGELRDGEGVADAARRLVQEATGTTAPKLEVVDLVSSPGTLTVLLRAMLVDAPRGAPTRTPRMGLPPRVGSLDGKHVEEALKTSLAYKLTRS